ncbi:hypothetical protein [Chlorobium phaeobacteroides]|uniref:hypothetical protein n=1 Tax=Chlorobium phaeobacteroides TaxID=1096 RepID=UPI001231EB40|nr:hypothetical protein [Chlorobium phaeobacteroides]
MLELCRQCLHNLRIDFVESKIVIELTAIAVAVVILPSGKFRKHFVDILPSVSTIEIRFRYVTANQPVTQDQADIDSSTCMSSQLCIGLPDCIDKLLEIRFVRCGKL